MTILNKIGRELVIDLINRDNNTSLTFDDVLFSLPTALSVTADFRNTVVDVIPKNTAKYKSTQKIVYWRLYLDKLIQDNDRIIPALGVTDTSELIDILNAMYNLKMTLDDVILEDIDTTIFPVSYVLKSHPNSYAYIGQVELTLTDKLIDLSEVVSKDLIAGIDYPMDPELSEGNVSFLDQSGFLLSAYGIVDSGMTVTNNGEIEVYSGVHTQDRNIVVMPTAGVYNMDLADTDEWYLDLGFGLYSGARAEDILELYDIDVTVTYALGGSASLRLIKDEDSNHAWSINGALPSADLVYSTNDKVAADSINMAWFKDAVAHTAVNSMGTIIGTFYINVRALPIKSIVVKPISLDIVVNANAL